MYIKTVTYMHTHIHMTLGNSRNHDVNAVQFQLHNLEPWLYMYVCTVYI